MTMFLMIAVMGLLATAVTAALFSAATRTGDAPKVVQVAAVADAARPRFFAEAPVAAPKPPAGEMPVEALLLQIERHIRLEQAAAESFLSTPTQKSLHSRTTTPLSH